jgi:hypothetical protein
MLDALPIKAVDAYGNLVDSCSFDVSCLTWAMLLPCLPFKLRPSEKLWRVCYFVHASHSKEAQ